MSNIYGYIRVSTITQRDDRQWLAMENFGIPKECIFVDKQSGKDFDRPAYTEMMAAIKPGDTVVVKSLDRLGRNYDEMMADCILGALLKFRASRAMIINSLRNMVKTFWLD